MRIEEPVQGFGAAGQFDKVSLQRLGEGGPRRVEEFGFAARWPPLV